MSHCGAWQVHVCNNPDFQNVPSALAAHREPRATSGGLDGPQKSPSRCLLGRKLYAGVLSDWPFPNWIISLYLAVAPITETHLGNDLCKTVNIIGMPKSPFIFYAINSTHLLEHGIQSLH